MSAPVERDALRALDSELHALLFPEQVVQWYGAVPAVGLTAVPCYSDPDDWSGMRAVIAAMRERGWCWEAEQPVDMVATATFHKHGGPYESATADTIPQAVAQAARAALEREAGRQ
jgi:hypothetical protein